MLYFWVVYLFASLSIVSYEQTRADPPTPEQIQEIRLEQAKKCANHEYDSIGELVYCHPEEQQE